MSKNDLYEWVKSAKGDIAEYDLLFEWKNNLQ